MKGKVLIVDDDRDLRAILSALFEDEFQVSEADTGAALQKALGSEQPDVVVLDVKLPDADGLELLPQLKKRWPDTEVIVLTGYDDVSMAVEAGKRGAYNFVTKPFENTKLLTDVRCALERKEQTAENSNLRRALETMSGTASPVFQSAAMRDLVRTVERIAPSDVAVLITGESGTGKEVIADLVHTFSPRSKGRIIKINCAALPRELIESELFGSVKGAFTGAHSDREGLFRQAEGGTLFLDEISEMPIARRANFARAPGPGSAAGGRQNCYKTNCRIVAATNRHPGTPQDGKLREFVLPHQPFRCFCLRARSRETYAARTRS
jgi:DNA-binding NtrC family response regulator